MDLQTGRMSRRGRCKKCKMTRLVIETVNEMAKRQGYKALKFLDRKKRPMLLNPINTLSGINAITNENLEALEQDDEEYLPLVEPENQEDEDSELIVDSDLDQGELADLLDDDEGSGPIPGDNIPDEDETAPDGDEVMSVDDDPDQCDIGVSQDSDDEAPSLVLEPEERPTRERQAPERYNPASGESYL